MKKGFSLVELSIVLVILGLLTGGILSGQSLIRAAELRSVAADIQRYQAATYTFRDKYQAFPGDMRNATRFWGDNNAACPDAAIANGTPGTCNGNGDGMLAAGATGSAVTSENAQYWNQLALAGLIEGTYTGITGSNGSWDADIGINCPRARISNAGFSVYWWTSVTDPAHTTTYVGSYGNMLAFGAETTIVTENPAIKPEEAWNIDTKIDDGRPAYGKVVQRKPSSGITPNCVTSNTASAAEYNLTNTTNACALLMTFQ